MIGRGDALLALGKGTRPSRAYTRASALAPRERLPRRLRGIAFEKEARHRPRPRPPIRRPPSPTPEDVRIMNNLGASCWPTRR